MIDIIKNIEAIRNQKRIKQEEMGRRLGVSQTGYSNYINRSSDMPFARLSMIADALEVSVIDIITWPEHYVPESEAHPQCEECKKKDEIIDNLNELLAVYKQKVKSRK